jgi:dephospho-CoA kinase
MLPNNQIAIGLSGLLSSGKTTSGEILEKFGFAYGRYSMVIASLVKGQNNEVNRKTTQEMGEYVNKEKGQRWLGNELLKLLPEYKNLVIDGLRFLEDYLFLKEKFGNRFFHIHLTADLEIRKQRYNNQKKNNVPFEEANSHPVENEVSKLQDFADLVISNNGSISNLESKLKQVTSTLCQSQ